MHIRVVSIAIGLAFACVGSVAQSEDTKTSAGAASNAQPQPNPSADSSRLTPNSARPSLSCQLFTHPPEKPHDPADLLFTFDQLEYWYRVPGEFTHRLDGDRYGLRRCRSSFPRRTLAAAPGSMCMTRKRRTYCSKAPRSIR